MRVTIFSLVLAAVAATSGLAWGNADDRKWIAQCVKDNAGARVSASVVRSYCTCMNDKMPDSETRSITQWEKSHKRERDECSRKAGWN